MRTLLLASSAALLVACGSSTGEDETPSSSEVIVDATAAPALMERSFDVMNAAGSSIGTVTISDLQSGGVMLDLDVTSIPAGSRAIHFHETASCVTPDFMSAGGHYNPSGHNHGFDAPSPNPHAGDMPNFEAPQSGIVQTEVLNERVTLSDRNGYAPLFDADGSALIIHAGADDYETQPTGAAGARIACAVITP